MSAAELSNEQSPGTDEQNADPGISNLAELNSLGAALAEYEQEPGGDDDSAKPRGSDEKATPTKFNELAGAVDLDLDALYKLEVTLDDGAEPVTIEKLKDSYKERGDFDLKVMEFEEQRTQQANDLVRAKAELQEILQALPANAIKPDVLKRIRDKSERAASEERQRTLDAIPDWKNDEARAADLSAMAEHLQAYGFPVNQLENLVDHRWQRYIRDNMLRERRVREAIAKVKAGSPGKAATSKPQGRAPKRGQLNIKPKAGQSKLEAALTNID